MGVYMFAWANILLISYVLWFIHSYLSYAMYYDLYILIYLGEYFYVNLWIWLPCVTISPMKILYIDWFMYKLMHAATTPVPKLFIKLYFLLEFDNRHMLDNYINPSISPFSNISF
jgi:hypothetical protein